MPLVEFIWALTNTTPRLINLQKPAQLSVAWRSAFVSRVSCIPQLSYHPDCNQNGRRLTIFLAVGFFFALILLLLR